MVDTVVTYRKMFFSWRPAQLPCRIQFIDAFWSFSYLIDKKNTCTECCCVLRGPGPLQTPAHLLHCYLFLCQLGAARWWGLRVMVRPIHGLSPYLSLQPPHCTFCLTLLTPNGHFLCKRKFGVYNQISKIPCLLQSEHERSVLVKNPIEMDFISPLNFAHPLIFCSPADCTFLQCLSLLSHVLLLLFLLN